MPTSTLLKCKTIAAGIRKTVRADTPAHRTRLHWWMERVGDSAYGQGEPRGACKKAGLSLIPVGRMWEPHNGKGPRTGPPEKGATLASRRLSRDNRHALLQGPCPASDAMMRLPLEQAGPSLHRHLPPLTPTPPVHTSQLHPTSTPTTPDSLPSSGLPPHKAAQALELPVGAGTGLKPLWQSPASAYSQGHSCTRYACAVSMVTPPLHSASSETKFTQGSGKVSFL